MASLGAHLSLTIVVAASLQPKVQEVSVNCQVDEAHLCRFSFVHLITTCTILLFNLIVQSLMASHRALRKNAEGDQGVSSQIQINLFSCNGGSPRTVRSQGCQCLSIGWTLSPQPALATILSELVIQMWRRLLGMPEGERMEELILMEVALRK